jgi:integrase
MARGRPRQEPKLVKKADDGWYIQFYDESTGQTRRLSTGTRDRREADRFFKAWSPPESATLPEPIGPRYPHQISVAKVLDLYAQAREGKITYSDRLGYAIKHLDRWWAGRNVDAILPETCEGYLRDRLAAGAAIATVGRELVVLRAAVKWAAKNAKLTSAPFVQLPPPQPPRERFLTRSEIAQLLWAARKGAHDSRLHLPLFILLAYYTGARSEAILTLRWFPQVDLDRNVIDFNPPGRAHTKKGRARLPIPRKLRWFLAKAQARSASPYVLSYRGEPIRQIKHSFASACRLAGLEDVTPHTLRHSCATWLLDAGVPLEQIGGWLGHSDFRTTQRYAHMHPASQARALAAFDRQRG